MTIFLLILWLVTSIALAVYYFLKQRADAAAKVARQQVVTIELESRQEVALIRENARAAEMKARSDSEAAAAYAQKALEQKLAELAGETERVRQHYEREALRVHQESTQQLEATLAELAPLRGYASLQDAENEVRKTLAESLAEAAALRQEAQILVDQTKAATTQERSAAQQRAKEIRSQADALLTQANRDASRIVEAAERRAAQIGGDALTALRDKQVIEEAVGALWNTVEGYGDRYVVPTRSLLDELAADFGHTQAGEELRAAREQSRRLVEMKMAATCRYEEEDRRDRANRFVRSVRGRAD